VKLYCRNFLVLQFSLTYCQMRANPDRSTTTLGEITQSQTKCQ
jgi:hypothetical protein